LSSQIVQATIGLFSDGQADESDLVSSEASSKWHGCCLALAEMARRGLVEGDMMDDLLPWVMKVGLARRHAQKAAC
jgi:hypothetical protein